jgi:hypothetical protein
MTKLNRAHAQLLATLASLTPPRIVGTADAADVLTRTEHLQAVHGAIIEYLEEVLDDTVTHLPAGPANQHEIELIVWDAVNRDPDYDVVAWLSRAGCPLGLRAAAEGRCSWQRKATAAHANRVRHQPH